MSCVEEGGVGDGDRDRDRDWDRAAVSLTDVEFDSRAVPLAAELDGPCPAAGKAATAPVVARGLFAWYVLRSEELSELRTSAAEDRAATECVCATAGESLTRLAK